MITIEFPQIRASLVYGQIRLRVRFGGFTNWMTIIRTESNLGLSLPTGMHSRPEWTRACLESF